MLKIDRSLYVYKSKRGEQAELNLRNKDICQTRVRYGYRRVHYAPAGMIEHWRELMIAAVTVRSMLGISPSAYADACEVWGKKMRPS